MFGMDDYEVTLKSNRFDHFNRLGSFNPGLLLVEQSGGTEYEKSLIWRHEYRHAKLSASILGRSIVFLQYIIVDMILQCLPKSSQECRSYISYMKSLEMKILQLIQEWAFLQEGVATFKDYEVLNDSNTEESVNLLNKLNHVLRLDNVYSKGFKLISAFSKLHKTNNTSPFHLFGNLPFQFDEKLNLCYQKNTLKKTLTDFSLAVVKMNGRSFREALMSKNWNDISNCLNEHGFKTNPTPNLSHSFMGFMDSMIRDDNCPNKYKERLECIKSSYQSNLLQGIRLTRIVSKIEKNEQGYFQLVTGHQNSSDEYEKKFVNELNSFLKISSLKNAVYKAQSMHVIKEQCQEIIESDGFSLIIQTYFPA